MNIEHNKHHAEYILPCAVNVLSEDNIIIDVVANVSVIYLFIGNWLNVKCIQYSNFNSILVRSLSLLGLFIFRKKIRYYGKGLEIFDWCKGYWLYTIYVSYQKIYHIPFLMRTCKASDAILLLVTNQRTWIFY